MDDELWALFEPSWAAQAGPAADLKLCLATRDMTPTPAATNCVHRRILPIISRKGSLNIKGLGKLRYVVAQTFALRHRFKRLAVRRERRTEMVRKAGLDTAKSAAPMPWRKARSVHDPGKILPDVALVVALGGDCLAEVGILRAEPAVFGQVASDPTVSRLIDILAAPGRRPLTAIRAARAEVRQQARRLAGGEAPDAGRTVTVDLDGVLVIAHSDVEDPHPHGNEPTATTR